MHRDQLKLLPIGRGPTILCNEIFWTMYFYKMLRDIDWNPPSPSPNEEEQIEFETL